MSSIDPGTVLKRAPNLMLYIKSEDEIQVIMEGRRLIRCGSQTLAILDVFARPTPILEAVKILRMRIASADEWIRLTGTIIQLYRNGVLEESAQSYTRPNSSASTTPEGIGEVIINPCFDLKVVYRIKTRHREPESSMVIFKDQPELCRLLFDLASNDHPPEHVKNIPEPLSKHLIDLGVLIRRQDEPDKVSFKCVLDKCPSEMFPYAARYFAPSTAHRGEYAVNPRVHIQLGSEPPDGLSDRVQYCDRFLQSYPVLWVEDPGTRVLSPHWMEQPGIELVERLLSKKIYPSCLDPRNFEMLARANIVVPKNYEKNRVKEWQGINGYLRGHLRSKQYATIRRIIHPLQLAALRSYFRALDEKGFLDQETLGGVTTRHVAHNEEVARFIHNQISPLVNEIAPEPVKPSYCYLSVYKSGAYLPKHIDRAQCAWNLSLLIDTEPEMFEADAWPIFLEVDGEAVKVQLEMGDGVLYRGTRIPHWRDPLPQGQMATLIFFHFVPVDFKGSLN